MQFKVPQFLDIEDKIFGPFTFKEFVYLVGGAGLCFIIFKLLGIFLGAIPIVIIAGFSLALTFYRPNNKPFINMVESGFKYFMQNKLYVWKKVMPAQNDSRDNLSKEKKDDLNKMGIMKEGGLQLTESKLRNLAWSLDVLDLSKNKKTGS